MKAVRTEEMEQYILKNETVGMEELRSRFGVSMNTVRRDVARLIQKGVAKKVYGGVCARKADPLPPYDVRTAERRAAKERLSAWAARLVRPGDIIFMDSGTTLTGMVAGLNAVDNVTVITNNLHVIMAALPYPNLTVIALPGQLQRRTASFTGMDTLRFLRGYNVRVAFMAATGLSLAKGVTNSSPLEYELKRGAMAQCEKSVLLLDSAKFGKTALMTYARPEDFSAIVTERQPPPEYAEALARAGVELLVAEA